MKTAPAKYRLQGTRRRTGAQGNSEPFDTVVVADGYDDAQQLARYNWQGDWQDILFTHVSQVA